MSRTRARVTQADIARALRAAQQAGPTWCVEVMPDGTIRLFQVDPSARSTERSPDVPVASGKVWRL